MRAQFEFAVEYKGVIPPSLFVAGQLLTVVSSDCKGFVVEVDSEEAANRLALPLGSAFGCRVIFKGCLKRIVVLSEEEVEQEMNMLMSSAADSLRRVQQISEPKLEVNLADPMFDKMVPIGKKIWDSIFRKREPVLNLRAWLNSDESNYYVYLPNDMSKQGVDTEDFINNGFYTEIMVNAYRALCSLKGIKPIARLKSGECVNCWDLRPSAGCQPTVVGETSSRLANSELVDFDDSELAAEFVECICALSPDQYERDTIRRWVLTKVEFILMGRTSHTYNQKFLHNLFIRLTEDKLPAALEDSRKVIVEHTTGILQQMVIEGYVLEDSLNTFIQRLAIHGLEQYAEDLASLYRQVSNGEQ